MDGAARPTWMITLEPRRHQDDIIYIYIYIYMCLLAGVIFMSSIMIAGLLENVFAPFFLI